MKRVSVDWRATLATSWTSTTWQDGWLLFGSLVYHRRNSDGKSGVTAVHPDGRVQRLVLKPMIEYGNHVELFAWRVMVQPEPESSRPRILRRGTERDLGAAFGFRHGGPMCHVVPDPLRELQLPHPDALYRYHSATQDAGDVTVETRDHYKGHCANKWSTNAHRAKLKAAFDAAGANGFVVYSRATGECRVFSLGEPVVRVEIRPDGMMAAAILKDNAVAFVDLGDD